MSLVLPTSNTRALESLVIGECGENAEDDRSSQVKLYAHETVRHGVTDVLEVHSGSLDEDTNSNDSVKLAESRTGRFRAGSAGTSGVVHQREQVGRGDQRGFGLGSLRLSALDEPSISTAPNERGTERGWGDR